MIFDAEDWFLLSFYVVRRHQHIWAKKLLKLWLTVQLIYILFLAKHDSYFLRSFT